MCIGSVVSLENDKMYLLVQWQCTHNQCSGSRAWIRISFRKQGPSLDSPQLSNCGKFFGKILCKIFFCRHYFSPLHTFMRKKKDPDPDPYLWLRDPDPGDSKTCGSGSGFPTLAKTSIPLWPPGPLQRAAGWAQADTRREWRAGWTAPPLVQFPLPPISGQTLLVPVHTNAGLRYRYLFNFFLSFASME